MQESKILTIAKYGRLLFSGLALSGTDQIYRVLVEGVLATGRTSGSSLAVLNVVVTAMLVTITAMSGIYAANRGYWTFARDSETPLRPVDNHARRRFYVVTAGLLFLFVLVADTITTRVVPVADGWIILVFAVLLAIWVSLVQPLAFGRIDGVTARPPTDEERARIDQCYERFGRSPGRIAVADELSMGVVVAGRGAFRSVRVSAPFLEAVSDEDLAVVLALADEKNRLRYFESFWTLFGAVVFAIGLSVWASFQIQNVGVALYSFRLVAVIVVVVVLLLLRRAYERAEAFACAQFGTDNVRATYRRLRDSDSSISIYESFPFFGSANTLFRHFHPDPPMDQRLDRLDAHQASSAATDHSYWWLAVASPFLVAVTNIVFNILLEAMVEVGLVSASQVQPIAASTEWLAYAFYFLTPILAAAGVYAERRSATSGGWRPSRAYYSAVIPIMNFFVAMVYLVQRFRHTNSW